MTELTLRTLGTRPDIYSIDVEQLTALLVRVVAEGGSVSFMHPLPYNVARDFWTKSLTEAAQGRRVILGAYAGEGLAGTVTLLLDTPPNQPHRAEIAKLMTDPAFRRRGVAASLLNAAERIAADHGRSLLTLDTAEGDGGEVLYEKTGYVRAGVIPDFAYKPHGGLTGTVLFWKAISVA